MTTFESEVSFGKRKSSNDSLIDAPEEKCREPVVKEELEGDLEGAAKLGHFPIPDESILGERNSTI